MNIVVRRTISNPYCVIGKFEVDDGTSYFSLELPLEFEGTENVPDRCCIPPGTYQLIDEYSPRHGVMKPRLVGVPDRVAIEIDEASCPSDLLGCTAIGENLYNQLPESPEDVVINGSDKAYAAFYLDFCNALKAGESVSIQYLNEF